MQVYTNKPSNIFSTIFIISEYILIIIHLLLFLKKINDLIKFPNVLYDKIPTFVIFNKVNQKL